jgi:UDP-N-acetylglucosamine 2-epimerase (non-hydrolysing)
VHVEAGIRSYDLTMPEEINRMVTDALADHFFTTTTIAGENLKNQVLKPIEFILWVIP